MLEEDNDDSKEDDPAKMYSTGEKRFDEPTSTVEEPMKKSICVRKTTLGP